MMERYDFDTPIERRNTDCLKYDFAVKWGMPGNILHKRELKQKMYKIWDLN